MLTTTLLVISSFFVAFLISYFAIPFIIKMAHKNNLIEKNNDRKIHTEKVSALGGIAIFIACWTATFMFVDIAAMLPVFAIFAGTALLFGIGVLDDVLEISAGKRLIIQAVAANVVYMAGFQLNGLYGLFGLYEIHPVFDYASTVFFVVLMINAYNCIDGINGLAGGLGMLNAIFFGMVFFILGNIELAVVALALSGALFGFLQYNFGKATIFMGDNGSTVVGLLLAVLAMAYLNTPQAIEITALPAITFSIVFIPIVDFLKVIVTRMYHKKSPFAADRTHIHHRFLNLGLDHSTICWILYTVNAVMVAVTTSIAPENGWITTFTIVSVALSMYLVVKVTNFVVAQQTATKLK